MVSVRPFALGLLLAVSFGCDGKRNPTAPTVTDLVISGADAVLTETSTTYTASATLLDGTTRAVMPTWTSSNPAVASVDNSGRLDSRTHGVTTLTATHEGRTASKTLQVVNNYGGRWSGRYIIRACKDSGLSWCRGYAGVGTERFVTPITIVQTGTNHSEIRATFDHACDAFFGSGTISGSVTADGRLNLEGTLKVLDWFCDPAMDVHLSGWDTNLNGAGSMTGRWAQNVAIIGQQGSAHEDVELVTMTRTSR